MKSVLYPLFLLLPSLANAAPDNAQIDILNWYPDCEYEVLSTIREGYKYKALKGYLDSPAANTATQKVFAKLRHEAQQVKADGIILTRKTVGYEASRNSATKVDVRLFFVAELIKNCQQGENSYSRVTPYNDNGNRNVLMGTTMQSRKPQTLVINYASEAPAAPEISESDVSLESGVYGLKLGASRDAVIASWGKPTVALALEDNHEILSFGRRHWLYFHQDRLQRIEYGSAWLGVHFLNGVYYESYFDEKPWTVFGQFTSQSKMADVDTDLAGVKSSGVLQRVIREAQQELVLNFHRVRNFDTDKVEPIMQGFVLQQAGYQPPATLPAAQSKPISDYFHMDNDALKANAIMHIALSGGREAVVMDNHTYIQLAKTSIAKIMAFESIFQPARLRSDSRWQFSQHIFQGQTVKELESKFGDDAIIASYDVSLINEDYRMVLATDAEQTHPHVYEAEIWVN